MKYIITESKLEQVVIKYLNKAYGDLEQYDMEGFPHSIFFIKNDMLYLEYHSKKDKLYVRYNPIWTDLSTMFGLDYDECKNILSKWIELTYSVKGSTPPTYGYQSPSEWWKIIQNSELS